MTSDVVSVAPETSYRKVVDALVDAKVSGAPVVDRERRVIGVVTEADLLRRRDFGSVARELMTAPPIMVGPDVSVAAAIRIIQEKRVKRLPVVDGQGHLLGIVSRRDMLRLHTRSELAIRHDIAEDVLGGALSASPTAIQVVVAGGVVTLTGRVDTRTMANRILELTADVAGVSEVVDRLRWDIDDSELIGPTSVN
jgi:CBS-domain-containing membrane protein